MSRKRKGTKKSKELEEKLLEEHLDDIKEIEEGRRSEK
ncbi:hypothetical protein AMET1_0642 [Methanonatronarchaeum thermophilum]|uniref:Uncharacterized protein n=1 Tax=Methanonatronarchaeum thermophilum TaxID=1927129 RepID=A0A1Y3GC04_9EURY|nr:hypothetical protein AMET1_0642 [Methanonatronarchaeum thermophilum]